jgi:hypothetical protein
MGSGTGVGQQSLAGRHRPERGSVSAELAVALPSVVVVLALVLTVGRVASVQVQCIDAARVGARQAARGESDGTAVDAARRFGPSGARVALSRNGSGVEVEVSAAVRMPGTGWPAITVRGHAAGPVEQP